ncbi:MAG: formyltransferase family protein [Bacteroidota bacterium]
MKLLIYAMTEKGFTSLSAILDHGFASLVCGVVIGQDAHLDDDFSGALTELASRHQLPVFERNDPQIPQAEYALAISWRWMIPESSTKLIVLHDSLLPRYRGFAPLVNMLINKEPEIGVTALFAAKEYDRGDIIAQKSIPVNHPLRISDAIRMISDLYGTLCAELAGRISSGDVLKGTPQNEQDATYSLWRDEEDYRIDWNQDAERIQRMVYAVSSPYKGAYTQLSSGEKIRVLDAVPVPDVLIENRTPGKVIFVEDGFPVVVCGTGLLKLTEAVTDRTKESALPFTSFRMRLS